MWIYKNKPIKHIEDVYNAAGNNVYGFIYKITNPETNMFYIGKKALFSNRKIKLSKKQLEELKDKRLKKYKEVIKESDWLTYTGSSDVLNQELKENNIEIIKEILEFTYSKINHTYLEAKYLFCEGVLEREDTYNICILNSFYKGKVYEL